MFLMIRLRLCIFDKNSTEEMLCPSQCIVPGEHDVDMSYNSTPFIFNGAYC